MKEFREFIYNQHDVVCNQKYADTLPYSFHIKAVEAQGERFLYLIEDETVGPEKWEVFLKTIVRYALSAHDCTEDARMTYNNVVQSCYTLNNRNAAIMVADIVYCVEDEKGKTRDERKSDKYYSELKENKLAIFVKLADRAANMLFGKLFNSKMYKTYKKEWPKFKEKLYIEEYKEFFDYIETI